MHLLPQQLGRVPRAAHQAVCNCCAAGTLALPNQSLPVHLLPQQLGRMPRSAEQAACCCCAAHTLAPPVTPEACAPAGTMAPPVAATAHVLAASAAGPWAQGRRAGCLLLLCNSHPSTPCRSRIYSSCACSAAGPCAQGRGAGRLLTQWAELEAAHYEAAAGWQVCTLCEDPVVDVHGLRARHKVVAACDQGSARKEGQQAREKEKGFRLVESCNCTRRWRSQPCQESGGRAKTVSGSVRASRALSTVLLAVGRWSGYLVAAHTVCRSSGFKQSPCMPRVANTPDPAQHSYAA